MVAVFFSLSGNTMQETSTVILIGNSLHQEIVKKLISPTCDLVLLVIFCLVKGASHLVAHQRIEKYGSHQQHISVKIPSDNPPLEKKKYHPL